MGIFQAARHSAARDGGDRHGVPRTFAVPSNGIPETLRPASLSGLERLERYAVACRSIGLDIDAFPAWPDDPAPSLSWRMITPLIEKRSGAGRQILGVVVPPAYAATMAITVMAAPGLQEDRDTGDELGARLAAVETGLRTLGVEPASMPLDDAAFREYWPDLAAGLEFVVCDRPKALADDTLTAFGLATDLAPGRPPGNPVATALRWRLQKAMHDPDGVRLRILEDLARALGLDPTLLLMADTNV